MILYEDKICERAIDRANAAEMCRYLLCSFSQRQSVLAARFCSNVSEIVFEFQYFFIYLRISHNECPYKSHVGNRQSANRQIFKSHTLVDFV